MKKKEIIEILEETIKQIKNDEIMDFDLINKIRKLADDIDDN